MKTPFHAFMAVLNGLFEKYGLSGLIDLAVGTGMNHVALTRVTTELQTVLSTGSVSTDQDQLLELYVVLLRQLLHNVNADDDAVVTDHLKKVMMVLDPGFEPEQVEERHIDVERFRKDDVLSILHTAIA